MSKTLIVFDTNTFYNKSNDLYHTFCPLQNFSNFLNFLNIKKLRNDYILAIPKITVKEVIKQKKELIKNKIDDFQKINAFFNVKTTIKQIDIENQLRSYLTQHHIRVLPFPKNLLNIIERAAEKRNPFRKSGENSDAGFKDVILWESILAHRYKVSSIIFFTRDKDFNEALLVPEFHKKFPNKEIIFIFQGIDFNNSFQKLKTKLLNDNIYNIAKNLLISKKTEIYEFLLNQYHINPQDILDYKQKIEKISDKEVKITAKLKSNTLEYRFDIDTEEPF